MRALRKEWVVLAVMGIVLLAGSEAFAQADLCATYTPQSNGRFWSGAAGSSTGLNTLIISASPRAPISSHGGQSVFKFVGLHKVGTGTGSSIERLMEGTAWVRPGSDVATARVELAFTTALESINVLPPAAGTPGGSQLGLSLGNLSTAGAGVGGGRLFGRLVLDPVLLTGVVSVEEIVSTTNGAAPQSFSVQDVPVTLVSCTSVGVGPQ